MFAKKLSYIRRHKIITAIIIVFIISGGFLAYAKIFKNKGVISYVTAQVQKGTLIISVSGSGQVSASNQIDIKPKVAGDIIYIGVKSGEEVKAGKIIAQLDVRDAEKAVRDAQINLDSAKLELEKMKGITTSEGILRGLKEKAENDLKKAYEDGFNTVSNAFLDLPDAMAGLNEIIFSSTLGGGGQQNADYYAIAVRDYDEKIFEFRNDAFLKYDSARAAYDKNFVDYKSVSRFSDETAIEKMIDETYDTAKVMAEAVKSTNNLVQFYRDKLTERNLKPHSLSDTHLLNLAAYTGKTNAHLLNLLSIKNNIQNDKEAALGAGFDIADQQIRVNQAENTLLDLKEKLADYFIRAPFDGVIAKLNSKKSDSVSSATILATIITKQKLAEISLNEVDVAKVKADQKTTLTFDAVPDLMITGQVVEIEAIGMVSQGVVTYMVKIAFDTQDERVKPGMSVSAAIITEAKPNVLLVSNSAVKSQNNVQYVEMVEGEDRGSALAANSGGIILKNTSRRQTMIEAGLSNDEFTEIVSGLKEGDVVVTRTIQPTAARPTQTQQQSGGLRIPGLNTGGTGGGGVRGTGGMGR